VGSGSLQRLRRRRGGGSGGEDVVDQEHAWRDVAHRQERILKGPTPLHTAFSSLGLSVPGPSQEPAERKVEPLPDSGRHRLRLVEASPPPAPPRQRNPGDHVGPELAPDLGHPTGEMARQGMPARELHAPDGLGQRSVV
jgi:hypothetical protein